jgi:hypothetical protein
MSWKTLQGSRFRRIANGIYVAASTVESHRVRIRGVLLALPPDTIATGVTGLQLLGVEVGPQLPMTFATTHPRQVRRRDVKVMRLKELPAHRYGIAAPEHCWLVAALEPESPRPGYRWRFADTAATDHPGPAAGGDADVFGSRGRPRACGGEVGTGACGLPRETWLRLCLGLAGLPMPECNRIIGDDRGPIGRVDLV